MSSRSERMLNAIANGEKITATPMCRKEMFLKAYANKEGTANLPEPRCREEQFYLAIIKGEPITLEPRCKKEQYLKAIANNEPIPESCGISSREEELFRKIIEEAGSNTPNLNYITNGVFYIREAYSATQLADVITLR